MKNLLSYLFFYKSNILKILLVVGIVYSIGVSILSTYTLHQVDKIIMENHLEKYFYGSNWNQY